MSDSDDTDILLLIPPDYYIANAEQNLLRSSHKMDAQQLTVPPTAAYQFLPPAKKSELNIINARLQDIAHGDDNNDNAHYPFSAPSDISTISTSTVRTQFGCNKQPRELHGVVHSTPKSGDLNNVSPTKQNGAGAYVAEDGILLEIDHYLDDHKRYDYERNWLHHSDDYRRPLPHLNFPGVASQEVQATSLPSALNRQVLSASKKPTTMSPALDNKLISLSEIWGRNGQATAIQTCTQTQSTLKEEQLRRQHLEKTVHTLQTQLLEYQQRISVAIEVDRTKDVALEAAQQECKSLNYEVQTLRDALHKFENESQDYKGKVDDLQRELAQAVGLATKFQSKNEKLESEVEVFKRRSDEACNQRKEQLEELELKLLGSKRAEECANNELQKLKDKYAKAEHQSEKFKMRCEDLEKENSTLRNQKEMLQEYHQKQKTRADSLEQQKKTLQESLANLTENESTLKKKLDSQQKVLKSHYQQQLENVVTQKLKEFQDQLDKNEEQLKAEARERERLIAERAVKQLEMINEKNEIELNLLQEKHNEEVELYRLQLANASKKIDEMEQKLSCYKSKRADIAEKLHTVMETQWQKALEILTSPSQATQLQNSTNTETDSESPHLNTARHYEATPKTSRTTQRSNTTEKNNLDAPNKKDPSSPMDKLQAYIELLLSKSPGDFDKLDEILALTSKYKTGTGKPDKIGKRSALGKPPWKA